LAEEWIMPVGIQACQSCFRLELINFCNKRLDQQAGDSVGLGKPWFATIRRGFRCKLFFPLMKLIAKRKHLRLKFEDV
jgi:hypothetical protein